MRVIVQGRLKQRSYEDREQVKRTVYELDADEVGPSLLRASAVVTKNTAGGQPSAAPAADGWAGARPTQQGGGWGSQQAPAQPSAPPAAAPAGGASDEPPF